MLMVTKREPAQEDSCPRTPTALDSAFLWCKVLSVFAFKVDRVTIAVLHCSDFQFARNVIMANVYE
jgi:hypothetical protein